MRENLHSTMLDLTAIIGARADITVNPAEKSLRPYGKVHQMLQLFRYRICADLAVMQE